MCVSEYLRMIQRDFMCVCVCAYTLSFADVYIEQIWFHSTGGSENSLEV